MIVGSYAASVPLILVYILVGGVAGDVALVAAGAAVIGTFGVTVVLSQEYMPSRIGMASGLSVGLAIGLGGIFAVALGGVADSIDLETALARDGGRPGAGRGARALASAPAAGAGGRTCGDIRGTHDLGAHQMAESAREFFEGLEGRIDPAKVAGQTVSYRFDIDGEGSWRVAVVDGAVTVTEATIRPTA